MGHGMGHCIGIGHWTAQSIVVCAAWLAQVAPLCPASQSVDRACDWIEAHQKVVRRSDEPCVGLLHAAATFALASAGREAAASALGAELAKRSDDLVSTPARALAIVAVIHSCSAAEWEARRPVVDGWMNELLQAQDLREWRTRRTLFAARAKRRDRNPTYGGFGLNLGSMPQASYDGNANVLSTALAALALRTYDRLGMELVPPNTKAGKPGKPVRAGDDDVRTETWPALAQFVIANQQDNGCVVSWPGSVAESRGATALGALALALARPALAPLQRDEARARAECEVATDALDAALRALSASVPDEKGAVASPSLLELAAEARLGWSCGARDMPLDVTALLSCGSDDGAADAPIELAMPRPASEAARWYAQEAPRRMLATALFVLAATEAGQMQDDELAHTLVKRLSPAALRPPLLPLLADLVASDGMAAVQQLQNGYVVGDQVASTLMAATIRARAGWDCGLASAGDAMERDRALLRFRRFLYDDRQRDPGRQHALGRFSKGVRGLLGDDHADEVGELLELRRTLGSNADADIAALLADPDQETRVAAARFCELLGVALDDFDPSVGPGDAAGPRGMLVERLKLR